MLRMKEISFGSYLKLLIVISLSSGLIFGFILFILSIFSSNVYTNLGSIQLHGIVAGIINIFLSPLLFAFFALLIGLLSFLPFKFTLKLMKGIKINLHYVQNDLDDK